MGTSTCNSGSPSWTEALPGQRCATARSRCRLRSRPWLPRVNPCRRPGGSKLSCLVFPYLAATDSLPGCSCICLDIVQPDDLVHSIACQHIFHAGCLEFWYLYENDNCPLCHKALMPQASSGSEGTG